MRTVERDVVAALIISSDNKFLMGKTAPTAGGVYSGSWVIPGGGIEKGETKLEALHREIMEETGLDISPYKPKLVEDGDTGQSEKTLKDTGERVIVAMNFFTYEIRIGKPAEEIPAHETSELVELRWIDFIDLPNEKLSPPTVKLLKKLQYMP
ncbi:MAG TPA: NUDIX hydrolase [Candidatus Saccharimonadales bacterium]|nr:NUDIX hydrolase [Candidatus Saccharimonadales bacterium]